ncbi:MAG TPA: hypothetical protein VH143_09520 [Kofleriaceae bacterium]|jgi:hypothetical protein|nr:hypothetical protein [Kofleriaceae bacterium]
MKFALAVAAALGTGCATAPAAAAPNTAVTLAPADVRAAIDADLGNVLAQTSAAVAATTQTLPGAMSAAALAQLFDTSATALHAIASPMTSRLVLPASSSAQLAAWLDLNVFADANLVADGTFALPASLVCGQPAASDCAAEVAAVDPRVRVAAIAGGVQLFVQLGAAHDEPIAIALTSTTLSATLDLDTAGKDLGGAFSGNASLALDVLGPSHVQATIAFASAITATWGGAHLQSAAGTPLTIDLDGSRPQIEATLALGSTSLTLGDTALSLAGATTELGFDGHVLTLDQVSLGAASATLAKAGQPAIAIDLNPNANRTFDAVLSSDADGVETVAVAPSLEIEQSIDHAVLGDAPPVYDVTDVALDAAIHGTAGDGSLEVVHGTLAIATAPASYGVTGTDARCVTSTPATSPAGQSYDLLAVATCQ